MNYLIENKRLLKLIEIKFKKEGKRMNLKYLYYNYKLKKLLIKLFPYYLDDEFKNKDKIKRGYKDAIDYAFFKVYHLWGCDSLTKNEKRSFNELL